MKMREAKNAVSYVWLKMWVPDYWQPEGQDPYGDWERDFFSIPDLSDSEFMELLREGCVHFNGEEWVLDEDLYCDLEEKNFFIRA